MDSQATISAILSQFRRDHPDGFAIALHIKFTAPRYLFQAYDSAWIDTYSREGLVMQDPTVRWGFANTGAVRWSALAETDGARVMARAAEHGLRFGATLALDSGGSRSVASFARGDRELTDAEIAALADKLEELHRLTRGLETLTPRFHDTLKQMSIYLTRG
jgi:LuxR family transcriptional regulator